MKRIITLAFLLFLIYSLFPHASASAVNKIPREGKKPVKVHIAVYVLDLDEVRTSAQSFDANVYFELRWLDRRLAHKGPDELSKPIAEIWNPRIQIVNQQKIFQTLPEIVEIAPDGEVVYRQRVWGSFSQPLGLRDFPFDRQRFTIQLASAGYQTDEVELIPELAPLSGIGSQFSVADWEILGWKIVAVPFKLTPNEEPSPGLDFHIQARRQTGYFIIKVIIPLIFIVMMSWIVFWIDPKESGTQFSVAITTMLTLIAYRFAVGAFLPKISYLTRLDYFIMASTFLIFASLIEVVITSTLARSDRLVQARKIDLWSRWIYPTLFVIITFETLVYRVVL